MVIDRILIELARRGHDTALVCGGPVGPRPYPVVEAGGVFSQYLVAPVKCRKRFSEWDLLIDVENGIPFFSPLWWKGPRLCLVHHVHTDQWRTRFGPALAGLGRWAEAQAMPRVYRNDLFVAVSESTAGELVSLGIAEERIRTVHSGIDLPSPERIGRRKESSEPLFVAVGRLVPHKRVELLLEAWESVRPVTGGRLVVVGEGPERAYLEGMAGEGVEFTGRADTSRRDELMGAAWLLVHAAHHEGWGVVIIEAAAWGVPTLAMDALGVRDAIDEGKSGLLAGTSEEFATRWIALAQDSIRREELGRGARRRAEGFTWGATIGAIESIAAELCG